jgi:hypothetical protein
MSQKERILYRSGLATAFPEKVISPQFLAIKNNTLAGLLILWVLTITLLESLIYQATL